MCFSATASFTASASLLVAGLYAIKVAWIKSLRLLPLAAIPLGFSIQQGLEGVVWLNLGGQSAAMVRLGAMGFFCFSHGIWPAWPALAIFFQEDWPWVKKILLAMFLFGCLFGLSLYGPFWLYPEWLSVAVQHGSIQYQTQLVYDWIVPRDLTRLIYLLMVVGPVCLSKLPQLKVLGGLVALSMGITFWFFNYAFVSVWCFFAAVISLYLISVVHGAPRLDDRNSQKAGTV